MDCCFSDSKSVNRLIFRKWTKVVTQGRGDQGDNNQQHIRVYHLEYTLDGVAWIPYQHGRTFKANTDWSQQVAHVLEEPIEAVSIKLVVH